MAWDALIFGLPSSVSNVTDFSNFALVIMPILTSFGGSGLLLNLVAFSSFASERTYGRNILNGKRKSLGEAVAEVSRCAQNQLGTVSGMLL